MSCRSSAARSAGTGVPAIRFDEIGNIQTGARTTWISQGNYQIATNHDPGRVIFLRSIDAQLRAVLVMRVHERRIAHAELRRSSNASSTRGNPHAPTSRRRLRQQAG